jgi:4-hydroxybenzoate polyprenyltransferase
MTTAMLLIGKTADYLRLIKFSHSVFALPFAFTGALLAAGGIPELNRIVWITVAMVGARTGAMGINRIIDRKIDALNPRTEMREIPRGVMSALEASLFTLVAFVVFVFAAYKLNRLCFMLSPLAILVVVAYPYTKRFTSLSHVVLGLALSFAPFGAWVAVRGSVDVEMFILSLEILFWVAGFDIFYALQDMEFDRSHGLYSIPGRLGVRASFILARIFHFITVVLLISLIPVFDLGTIYLAGVIISAALLLYEHMIVKPSDLSRLDMAFFTMNGYISITVFLFTLLHYVAGNA